MNLVDPLANWFQCHKRAETRGKDSDTHPLLHHAEPLVKILYYIPSSYSARIRCAPRPRDLKPRDVLAGVENLEDHALVIFWVKASVSHAASVWLISFTTSSSACTSA